MSWPYGGAEPHEPRSPRTPPDCYDFDLIEVAAMELDPWSESNALAAFRALAESGVPFQARDIILPPYSVPMPDNAKEANAFLGGIAAKALALGLVEVVGRVCSKSRQAHCRKVNLYRGKETSS